MKPEQRRLCIAGLITIGLACISAGIYTGNPDWIPVVSTVVVGLVGVAKFTKDTEVP